LTFDLVAFTRYQVFSFGTEKGFYVFDLTSQKIHDQKQAKKMVSSR
jgi:hypothetical protein